MFANAPKVGNKCHLQLGTGSSCVFTCTLFEHLCVCVHMLYGYVRVCVCVCFRRANRYAAQFTLFDLIKTLFKASPQNVDQKINWNFRHLGLAHCGMCVPVCV